MSRVINFLSGDTANFITSEGNWYVSSGTATLTPTREKQIFSDVSSLRLDISGGNAVTLAASAVAMDSAYTGWPLKSSAWIWSSSDIKVYSNLYIDYVSLSEQASAEQFVRGQKWTLVKVNETVDQNHPDETTNVAWEMVFTDPTNISTLAADTIYIANPVLATPHAVMVSPFDNELYLRLPEYMRTADSQQEDPDYPLFRFIDVTFMEPGDVWDLWERLRYIDPVSEGGEKLSELVDPATIDTAWMPWLASILGLQFFNPSTGFTSWAALEAALATWQAWEEDIDPTPGGPDTEWSEIELFQPDSVDLESELRWQLSTAVYGLNGGTTGALKIAAKHVLTDTQTVVVNRNVGGDPWHIELVTLLSETPDVVSAGDSSGTVLDVIAPAIPAGYEVSHRAEVSV